jgi:hypothetical protein
MLCPLSYEGARGQPTCHWIATRARSGQHIPAAAEPRQRPAPRTDAGRAARHGPRSRAKAIELPHMPRTAALRSTSGHRADDEERLLAGGDPVG